MKKIFNVVAALLLLTVLWPHDVSALDLIQVRQQFPSLYAAGKDDLSHSDYKAAVTAKLKKISKPAAAEVGKLSPETAKEELDNAKTALREALTRDASWKFVFGRSMHLASKTALVKEKGYQKANIVQTLLSAVGTGMVIANLTGAANDKFLAGGGALLGGSALYSAVIEPLFKNPAVKGVATAIAENVAYGRVILTIAAQGDKLAQKREVIPDTASADELLALVDSDIQGIQALQQSILAAKAQFNEIVRTMPSELLPTAEEDANSLDAIADALSSSGSVPGIIQLNQMARNRLVLALTAFKVAAEGKTE